MQHQDNLLLPPCLTSGSGKVIQGCPCTPLLKNSAHKVPLCKEWPELSAVSAAPGSDPHQVRGQAVHKKWTNQIQHHPGDTIMHLLSPQQAGRVCSAAGSGAGHPPKPPVYSQQRHLWYHPGSSLRGWHTQCALQEHLPHVT